METESINFLGTFTTEFYYFMMSVLMVFIHIGFMVYEGGAVRSKNVLATMQKNYLTLSSIGITFFLFGWWIYNAFPNFPVTGAIAKAAEALPWSASMGPNMGDNATGVFWFAFVLFAMTTASILSGAVVERMKIGAYILMSVILGSILWVIAAAWGWHPDGWLTTKFGFHDFGCAAVVHGCAGLFTLGVLINLGPRIGKFKNGVAQAILPHNLPLTLLGLMLIYGGFYGFLGACLIYDPTGTYEMTIYGTPMTLSTLAFNITIAMVAGFMGSYIGSKGEPFFTLSGGLAGIIGTSAGMDLYHPLLVLVLAFGFGFIMPKIAMLLEKKGIDDVVGAFAVHGFCGFCSPVVAGLFCFGYPAPEGIAPISIFGQILGTLVCCILLGFLPGLGISFALKKLGMLRVEESAEIRGLDDAEIGSAGYPEKML